MKALALVQPWATLVVSGAKKFETRSWRTDFKGVLLIHASKGMPKWARELCFKEPYRSALLEAGYGGPDDLPKGGIIGSVTMRHCYQIMVHAVFGEPNVMGIPDEPERAFGDWGSGRYAWEFTNPDCCELIPYKGMLGIFQVKFS